MVWFWDSTSRYFLCKWNLVDHTLRKTADNIAHQSLKLELAIELSESSAKEFVIRWRRSFVEEARVLQKELRAVGLITVLTSEGS